MNACAMVPRSATNTQPAVRWLARAARQLVLYGLVLLAPSMVWAAEGARSQLQAFVDQVQSATGQFTQTSLADPAQGARAAPQRGQFAFRRPGRFRWQILEPHEQLIVSDGQRVFQYDPDLEQVTERRADQAVGASPAALLFGSGSLADAFDLQDRPSRDGLAWLRAVPRNPDAGFVHVDIGLADDLPRRLELLDAFGQITRIDLSGVQTGVQLPEDTFDFEVPAGAALVRMN
ncbi:outer membrane lipoprotein chaperone LolA [Castellaniella sp.]|uniref:outer membrane lipoprotein chaperone LolA n=1 Tax=Castellaniella sp. TaxID=1955812 RepID=UPI00355E977E